MTTSFNFTRKAEDDGVGTEDATATENTDYLPDSLTALPPPLAYLRLHGYVVEVDD